MPTADADADADADAIIRQLGLQPHPEGGHYVETFRDSAGRDSAGRDSAGRDSAGTGGRAACTAIYFLLQAGERSHWHRVDAVEIWHWYAGASLGLSVSPDGGASETLELGPDLAAGQRPQAVVPAHVWQSAVSRGAWTLVGCTVAPGFEFSGFELAPPDWQPTPFAC